MRGMMKTQTQFAMVLALALLTQSALGAYVITKNNKKISGSDIRAKSSGEIILTTPSGTRTFLKGQYARAVADKPAEFDKARSLIDAKQYDEAVKLLDQIIREYRFLEWDNQARMLKPRVYSEKGDYDGAVSAFDELFRASPRAEENDEVRWAYYEVLLRAGKQSTLEPKLDEIIESGSRDDAARAQVMRGDLNASKGELENAWMDYMRTVVLFKQQQDVQPEALYKAADTMEKLRDRRAKNLFQELIRDYPGSSYAAMAQKRL